MVQDSSSSYANVLAKHAASHAYDGYDPLTSSATSVVGDVKMAYGVIATLLAANPGWALMDGTVVLPDGTTPPDMRDRVPIGAGTTYALGATGGAVSNVLNHDTQGTHQHDTKDLSHSHTLNFAASLGAGATNAVVSPTATATLTHALHSVDGGHAHTGHTASTLQPYAALYFLIYVGH